MASRIRVIGVALFSFAAAGVARASLRLPDVFADHMVLQSGMAVPIWGDAEPAAQVTVRFAGQSVSAGADASGHWKILLKPLAVSAKPGVLRIESAAGAKEFRDVLVGEVWLCSGQSNMYWPLGKIEQFPGAADGEEEIARAEQSDIRLFTDGKDKLWKAAGWQRANPSSRRAFSATAWYFGSALQTQLGVPVGLIHVSRGGTPIQQWTPREAALRDRLTRRYAEIYQEHRAEIDAHLRARSQPGTPALSPELETATQFRGFELYETLIKPLVPFAVRGVIWYQGESNALHLDVAQHYGAMLRGLIDGWRAAWGQERMPWYVVQLPGWEPGTHGPWIRQAQLDVSQSMKDVGLAVTTDVGDAKNLHPPRKREVGERLAWLALSRTYERKILASGPALLSVSAQGNQLHLTFDDGGAAMGPRGGDWTDVEVAGADGVYHAAIGRITGSEAAVSSPEVASPVAVRYGWKPFAAASLFNIGGLPASPFSASIKPAVAARAVNPAYEPVRDDPALPRVLLLGDSISIGYTVTVRDLLKGLANVHRPPANCSSTRYGLQNLDRWLGDGKWDVIHFNFGLHDCFVEDGKHPVPIEEYEQNLRSIIAKLRKTGARLIWASTTPITGEVLLRPRDRKPIHDFYEKDIVAYNLTARRVMEGERISIDDLHGFVLPQIQQIQKPHDVHFSVEGSLKLAAQVAAAIRSALDHRPASSSKARRAP